MSKADVGGIEWLGGLEDPEGLEGLGDLGIIRGVTVAVDGAVEVALTPTYVGCPATEAIAADVRSAVSAAAATLGDPREVRTRTVLSPAWTTDWITDAGRRKLAEHGIAPPTGRGTVRSGAVTSTAPGNGPAADDAVSGVTRSPVPVDLTVRCPRCGSTETRLVSAFGSTPCQSLRACRSCGEPFGAIKTL